MVRINAVKQSSRAVNGTVVYQRIETKGVK